MSSSSKNQEDAKIRFRHYMEPAIFLGYDQDTDTITFRCPECGHIDTCPGYPPSWEHRCKQCTQGLILYNHQEWTIRIREEKSKKKKLAEEIVPFMASFSAVLLSYLFLKSVDEFSSLDLFSGAVLTIIGGFCFRFAYAILHSYFD